MCLWRLQAAMWRHSELTEAAAGGVVVAVLIEDWCVADCCSTDYQEKALAVCCGACMYNFRITYGRCYDMCNW